MEQMKPLAAFDHLKGWKLLKGSHYNAGQGGGCFNEVAMVAAGYAYRPVSGPKDCPESFSRVFSVFGLIINDNVGDQDRQMLVPFITRMNGSMDSDGIEMDRAQFLMRSAEKVRGYERRGGPSPITMFSGDSMFSGCGCYACKNGLMPNFSERSGSPEAIAARAAELFINRGDIMEAMRAFDDAMRIGRQADPLDNYLVADRIEMVKASTPTVSFSGPAHPYGELANSFDKYMKTEMAKVYGISSFHSKLIGAPPPLYTTVVGAKGSYAFEVV